MKKFYKFPPYMVLSMLELVFYPAFIKYRPQISASSHQAYHTSFDKNITTHPTT